MGGLLGANALAGFPFGQGALLQLAIALEGHPDNVVPALLGGCRLAVAAHAGEWTICDIPWHTSVVPVVAIPRFELSTQEARRVLPETYPRSDAIFNAAHLGLLLRGLSEGREDWLRVALQDRVHQPYRKRLIRGYDAVHTAALQAGACGFVISGAGPTLLALVKPEQVDSVVTAVASAWAAESVLAKVLGIDSNGATIQSAAP